MAKVMVSIHFRLASMKRWKSDSEMGKDITGGVCFIRICVLRERFTRLWRMKLAKN